MREEPPRGVEGGGGGRWMTNGSRGSPLVWGPKVSEVGAEVEWGLGLRHGLEEEEEEGGGRRWCTA